jgi:Fur family zinc uptake transcriptional regulator
MARTPFSMSAQKPRNNGTVLEAAVQMCAERGVKLTAVRREVLKILSEADQPLGAYALLSRLQVRLGRIFQPPSIYRALETLMRFGLIERIETRNAYVFTGNLSMPHSSLFFLCSQCNASVAVDNQDLMTLMAENASVLGFRMLRPVLECDGICASCSDLQSTARSASYETARSR